jgi:Ca2+-binding RTX toxin-like protein
MAVRRESGCPLPERAPSRDGHDCLVGGSGRDRLLGEDGYDRLTGGSGRDRLDGGPGRNAYDAGSGDDQVKARNGRRETVRCGPGDDSASVDRNDRVRGCETVRKRA